MAGKSVEQLLSGLRLSNPPQYEMVQEIRRLVFSIASNASERVMYGGLMFAAPADFCGVFAYTEHVSVEFGRGCDLDDPHQELEGKGKMRRHIKMRTPIDIEAKHVIDYVEQAYQNSTGD